MKLNKEEQKKVILEAFDGQRVKFEDSWAVWNVLMDAIAKMARIDVPLSAEMLESLIDEHLDDLYEEDHENVFSLLLYSMIETAGEEKAWQVITYNNNLQKYFFEECGHLDEYTYDAVGYYAANRNVKLADKLMNMIYANKHLDDSLSVVLLQVWSAMKNWSDYSFLWTELDWSNWDNAVVMLKSWITKIPDPTKSVELEQKIKKENYTKKK